jgi:hypothetical protein
MLDLFIVNNRKETNVMARAKTAKKKVAKSKLKIDY